MELARRIRGEHHFDYRVQNELTKAEEAEFISLPYFNVKEGTHQLKQHLGLK